MLNHTTRRDFFRSSLFFSAGLAGGAILSQSSAWTAGGRTLAQEPGTGSAEARLRELEIELPPAPAPVAVYVPAVRSGNMLYASGHGPRRPDGQLIEGAVGRNLTVQQGYEAARLTGLNVLSTVRATLGSLDQVARLVKVLGMVNCTPDFRDHPQVINGFSELMVQVFGEQNGKGARSAVGMGSLPSNIAVEIEAIFELRG